MEAGRAQAENEYSLVEWMNINYLLQLMCYYYIGAKELISAPQLVEIHVDPKDKERMSQVVNNCTRNTVKIALGVTLCNYLTVTCTIIL